MNITYATLFPDLDGLARSLAFELEHHWRFDPTKPVGATAEEARAIVAGSIAYYGTYTVDEATKTIVPKVEGSTFPNMVGTDQSRVVTSITADEMRFVNPKAPAGVLEIVWKRAK